MTMSKVFPAKMIDVWPYESDYVYDIECYPNLFTMAMTHAKSGAEYFIEISEWVDDSEYFNDLLYWMKIHNCRMIGFNNIAYDYTVIHHLFMKIPTLRGKTRLEKAQAIYIISSALFKPDADRFKNMIWDNQRIIEQIDLFKLNHFDNVSKMTSLKVLEINMRSETVKELPVKPNTWLTYEERLQIIPYNKKDVAETLKFLKFCLTEIKLREDMSAKYFRNFMNDNDTKIGEEYFKLEFKKNGIDIKGRTPRKEIIIKDLIFPFISFKEPEFNRVLDYLNSQIIRGTKGADYPCATVNGFPWQFGKGGMHGSIASSAIHEDDEYEIIDADVTSFYPRTAIVNGLYPLHLTKLFCELYNGVFEMRKVFDKGTVENLVFKLALNGAYGKSNSEYSVFYDPLFTMTITINGQLMLCMLGEWLSSIPTLTMIQANTDGVTFRVKRKYRESVMNVCKQWEKATKLDLEYAYYKSMYIRDVNNYIAHYNNDPANGKSGGKLKNKGAYVHQDIPWHKDHSAVVIARAAEMMLVHGIPTRDTIKECKDPFDFMIKTKVPKSSYLVMRTSRVDQVIQNVTRYIVTVVGGKLVKIMPPTDAMRENWYTGRHFIRDRDDDYKVIKKGGKRPAQTYRELERHEISPEPSDREIGINSKHLTHDVSDAADFNWSIIDYDYYIDQANKLVDPITG